VDFTYAEEMYEFCIEILKWIDPELIKWIENIDSVRVKIANAKTVQAARSYSST
jgi:hypothetical protein